MKRLLFFLLMTSRLLAQDGGQLYTLYCSACHGADGKGATGGQFPPLANSAWPVGNAERSIKIVLLGLNGPVEVNGKTYNLEMPPQGAAITDENIAAILTHVRSSWGNKASAVSVDQVKKVRASLGKRAEHWTADELLKLHPLENVKPPIEKLISHYYKGSFQKMPDFSKLTAAAVEEEPSGLIDYSDYANTDNFAMSWDGEIFTPAGEHEWILDSDDGSRLLIDGNMIAEIPTIGPIGRTVRKKVKLTQGMHKIRLEYFEFSGQEGLSVGVKIAGKPKVKWLSKETAGKPGKSWPEIMLKPSADRAVIYRNFIQGTTARGIGVGFPGGVNMAFSGDHLTAELIWSGDFIDAGHHWTDRGVGNEAPASDQVLKASNLSAYAFTSEAASAWPATSQVATRFRGYQLDDHGNPNFAIEVSGLRVLDQYRAETSPAPTLVRRVRLTEKPSAPVSLLLLNGTNVTQVSAQECQVGDVTIKVEGAAIRYANNTAILDLKEGEVIVRYTWK
jgi:mono/diheme cytochrome c family protein